MNFVNLLKLSLFYLLSLAFGFFLHASLFHIPLFPNNIFFYRGIYLLILSVYTLTILLLVLIKNVKSLNFLDHKDVFVAIVITFSFNMLFFTHLPVTANRSQSIFILGHLAFNNGQSFTSEELTKNFSDIYVYKYNEVDRRLKEQVQIGNIIKENNKYSISKKGIALKKLYLGVTRLFNIDDKYLTPK
jgi:hypothetical protein